MGTEFDELTPLRASPTLPPAVGPNASHSEMVRAVNGLAVEVQLIRMAVQEGAAHNESFRNRIDLRIEDLFLRLENWMKGQAHAAQQGKLEQGT